MDTTSVTRETFLRTAMAGAYGALLAGTATRAESQTPPDRPNILWLAIEDCCPDFGCYGNRLVKTPAIDAFSATGLRFENAFCTGPVCSASRSAFHTGMYQTATGAQHHRSHRKDGYHLPEGVRLISERMRDAGYHTFNASFTGGAFHPGKTDFNFAADGAFDGLDWRERPAGKPFFGQINFLECHRGQPWTDVDQLAERVDPAAVTLPPYYPDDPVVRKDIATYLDTFQLLDAKVDFLLKRLEEDGLADNTAVFLFGDNGQCLLRGKQWLYEGGVHVPMVLRWPGHAAPGVENGLVTLLDMTATSLTIAGIPIPAGMHGRPLFGPDAKPRGYVVAARDRCDETRDCIRSVRTQRYKYIRNLMPDRPYTQPNEYIRSSYPVLGVLERWNNEGRLSPEQALFMAARKPDEELYDLEADPYEVRNLAGEPDMAGEIERLRGLLDDWRRETHDPGPAPEPKNAMTL